MASSHTARGLDRLLFFSDATVAIAITLLILPSVDFASEIAHTSLGTLLGDHWTTLLALVVSFAVIGNLWLAHHQLFELMADYNYGLAWLNLLWLLSIVLIPFSTSVLANAPSGDRAVYALYIGTIVVSSGTMVLMRVVLRRHPELMRPEARGELRLAHSLVPTTILALALVLAELVPQVGISWLFLLLLTEPADRVIDRVQRRRGTP
ncbi:MAG: TMEM175 family protein [Galbitalea sp.]